MIDWNAFTWDAFATLITALVGLLAVGGAIYVGIKQAGIAKAQTEIAGRQTAILHRQVELEEVKLSTTIGILRSMPSTKTTESSSLPRPATRSQSI